nr:DNRLRE domain-containing protein [bacterium]
MKSIRHMVIIASLAFILAAGAGTVSATEDQGLVPPMRPSMHLCTGYPTSPPTHTPTPTPQPTATPASEFIDTNLCAADTYVSAHSPNMNFGSSQVLTMRKNEYYIYMRFILRQLNPDASIIHSILRLTPFEIPPVSSTVRIYATSNDWTEDTLTYANRPPEQ